MMLLMNNNIIEITKLFKNIVVLMYNTLSMIKMK